MPSPPMPWPISTPPGTKGSCEQAPKSSESFACGAHTQGTDSVLRSHLASLLRLTSDFLPPPLWTLLLLPSCWCWRSWGLTPRPPFLPASPQEEWLPGPQAQPHLCIPALQLPPQGASAGVPQAPPAQHTPREPPPCSCPVHCQRVTQTRKRRRWGLLQGPAVRSLSHVSGIPPLLPLPHRRSCHGSARFLQSLLTTGPPALLSIGPCCSLLQPSTSSLLLDWSPASSYTLGKTCPCWPSIFAPCNFMRSPCWCFLAGGRGVTGWPLPLLGLPKFPHSQVPLAAAGLTQGTPSSRSKTQARPSC